MDGTGISAVGAKALRSPCQRCDRFPESLPDCITECTAISRYVHDLNANYGRPMGMCLLCMQERAKRNALLRQENNRRKKITEIVVLKNAPSGQEVNPMPPADVIKPIPPAPEILPATNPAERSMSPPSKCPKHPENDLLVVTRNGQAMVSNFCHQCMVEMGKKGVEACREKRRTTRLIPKDEAVLAVDLREHPNILAMLRQSMADGMRPNLEVEVIWHLKQRLKSFGEHGLRGE